MVAKVAEGSLVIGEGRLESRGKAAEMCALALPRDVGFPLLSLSVVGNTRVARRVVLPERIALAQGAFPKQPQVLAPVVQEVSIQVFYNVSSGKWASQQTLHDGSRQILICSPPFAVAKIALEVAVRAPLPGQASKIRIFIADPGHLTGC